MTESWWGHLSGILPVITALFSALAAVLAWAAKLWWSKEFAEAKDQTIKSKEAEIAALKTQITSVSAAKDEVIKARDAQIAGVSGAKDAEISVLRSQITSMTNNHDQLLKAKDATNSVLERQIQELRELNPVILRDQFKAAIELGSLTGEMFKNQLEKTRQELESKKEEIVRLKDSGKSSLAAIEIEEAIQEKEHLEKELETLKTAEDQWLERWIEDSKKTYSDLSEFIRPVMLKALEIKDRRTQQNMLYSALYEYIELKGKAKE